MAEEGKGTTDPQGNDGAAAAAGQDGQGGDAAAKGDQTDGGSAGEGADQQQGGDQASGEGDGEASAVPESYEWNMPEGMEVDQTAVEAFEPVLRDLGLSQEQADKMTGAFSDWISKAAEAQAEEAREKAENWITQMREDPTYGGDELDENLAVARQVIEKGGGEELRDFLNETGLGNHPAMVRFALWVNSVAPVTQDAPGSGGTAASGGQKADYEKLYPDMAKAG